MNWVAIVTKCATSVKKTVITPTCKSILVNFSAGSSDNDWAGFVPFAAQVNVRTQLGTKKFKCRYQKYIQGQRSYGQCLQFPLYYSNSPYAHFWSGRSQWRWSENSEMGLREKWVTFPSRPDLQNVIFQTTKVYPRDCATLIQMLCASYILPGELV